MHRFTFLKLPLFLTLLFGMGLSVQATHFMGVDITYECIDACNYKVTHSNYYDCTGGATTPLPGPPPVPSISFTGFPSNCSNIPSQGTWTFVSYSEKTPICPADLNLTGCNGGGLINGVLQGTYTTTINFCPNGANPCDSVKIAWSSCCRNGGITSGAANQGIYTGNTTINPNLFPCNSSPKFLNVPVPYICPGQPFTFNQGALDPDGDSLSYMLVNCMQSANSTVSYNNFNGFSAQQPLGNTWNVTMNSLTGDVTITPNPSGQPAVGVMCIEVTEWRNGVPIGHVIRDIQITVLPPGICTGTNPQIGGVQNPTLNNNPITSLSLNEVMACDGLELCFDIPTINNDPNINYTMFWDKSLAGATFVNINDPWQVDTVYGNQPTARFCWTPNKPGVYKFLLTVIDDNCPLPGKWEGSIIMYINDGMAGTSAVADTQGCNEVLFTALPDPGAVGPFSYQWLGGGGLTSNPKSTDSILTHFYPAPGSYNYQFSILDSIGCSYTVSGTVDILNGATADAGQDKALCSGYSFDLGAPAIPGQTYSWFPATGLNSSTTPNPTGSITNTGNTPDTLNYVLTADNGTCITYDFAQIVVFPTPAISITPANPSICEGDSILLTAQGGTNYFWSTGDTSSSVNLGPTSNFTLSVVSFANGCASPPLSQTVIVKPKPQGQLAGLLEICPGTPTTLNASGGQTYQWNVPFLGASLPISGLTQDSTFFVIPFNGGCPGDTLFATIDVLDQPLADFQFDLVCTGAPTTFSDLSSVANSSIVLWEWDFADPVTGTNNRSVLQNPEHVFSTPGIFNVSLQITSANGCSQQVVIPVAVMPSPEVDFAFSNVCEGAANTFVDASTIASGSMVDWQWDFGDGTAIQLGQNVQHSFAKTGYYNVTLSVVSDNGCQKEFTKTVFVYPIPDAGFTVLNACQDSVVFTSNSSTVQGSLDYINVHSWDFDDPAAGANNTSTQTNPVHVYANAGVYTITLQVTTQNGCVDQVTQDVTVYAKPVVNYVADKFCENTPTQFQGSAFVGGPSGNDPVNWKWNFGDGSKAATQSVTHSFLKAGPGDYPVYLAVKTQQGCVDTFLKTITINPAPVPKFAFDIVCEGVPTPFTDGTEIAYTDLVNWNWEFGDNIGTSLDQSPTYTYQYAGTYDVKVNVVSEFGCERTTTRKVTVRPVPDLALTTNDVVCVGDQAFLQALTPADIHVNWYNSANSSEPFFVGNSFTTFPLAFNQTYYVQAENQWGCTNERQLMQAQVFSAESAQIIGENEIRITEPRKPEQYEVVTTANVLSYAWSFGDGGNSDLPKPSHLYSVAGLYDVRVLMVDENGCELELFMPVEVIKPVNVYIPTGFTPNADGFNDFLLIGFENVSEAEISIFNRWGEQVFFTQDLNFRWNGVSITGSPVPEGVYVVHVRGRDLDGNRIDERQTLTVLR